MSNPMYFCYNVCSLKVSDMNCMDIVKLDEVLEPQDESQKVEKLKESHLLLKKKLSLSHELIKQYNDKVQECQQVTKELEAAKNTNLINTQKYNAGLTKIMQLELQNDEYRQKIEHFSKIMEGQETKIAADSQHLQQLICRVQELEHNESGKSKKEISLREKVKVLENALKTAKQSHELALKEMNAKLNIIKTAEVITKQTKSKDTKDTHEKSTCTGNELEPVTVKPATANKCTLTNDFYSIKDDQYPLFCSKCEIRLDPIPLDQILKQMSSCPTFITQVSSPSTNSESNKSQTNLQVARQMESLQTEITNNSSHCMERNSDISKSDFQRLERKLYLLEKKLRKQNKKGTEPQSPCCNHQYLGNCHLGPYPNFFPPGPLVQPNAEMFQFRNWQHGVKSKKRRRQISTRKSSLHVKKSAKRQKLQDGTSTWDVDPVSSKDPDASHHMRTLENHSELSYEPSRVESPPLQFRQPSRQSSNPPKEKDVYHPLKRKKRDKLAALFSPVASLEPGSDDVITNTYTDDEICNERQTESSVLSRLSGEISDTDVAFMTERSTDNSSKPAEYEIEECALKRRNKGIMHPTNKSTKSSLVKKIRNLKKNCNKSKFLVNKVLPANNSTKKVICKEILGDVMSAAKSQNNVNSLQLCKNNQSVISGDDYGTVKKHRIAHTAYKSEEESLCAMITNAITVPKVEQAQRRMTKLEDNSSNDMVINDVGNKSIALTENINISLDKENVTTRWKENPNVAAGIECKNNLKELNNTNTSQLGKNSTTKSVIVDPVGTKTPHIGEVDNAIIQISSTSEFSESRLSLNVKKVSPLLQPCVLIPKVYLGIQGVPDPSDTMQSTHSDTIGGDESATNISSSNKTLYNEDASLRILRSNAKINKSNDEILQENEFAKGNEDVIEKNPTVSCPKIISRTVEIELTRCDNDFQLPGDNDTLMTTLDIPNTSISVASDKSQDRGNELLDDGKLLFPIPDRVDVSKARNEASPLSPMRELRSRRIMLSASKNLDPVNSTKISNEKINDTKCLKSLHLLKKLETNFIEGFSPRALVSQYLVQHVDVIKYNALSKKKANVKLQQRREKLLLNELSKLTEHQEWTTPVLSDTIKLVSKFKTHTIAKCTIDFLAMKAMDDEELDRTYTPPAPLMSKSQQRILTMLVVLNRTIPNIIQLVQAGIEYKLFRLGYAPEVAVVVELARVFIALARIRKDREKVRILCCDALYCLGMKAMPILYVSLISWPEVIPMAGSSSDPLLLCLIEMVMMQEGDPSFCKAAALKQLLSGYYNYESGGPIRDTLIKDFMSTLKEKRQNGLDTAIIIHAKRKGPNWAYTNIIKGGLLSMIIHKTHPSTYDAFSLLGHLMRSFPLDDKQGLVKNILEQLCMLMESGEGPMSQQEGVATALLSLARHDFTVVIKAIMNWEPSEPLSKTTLQQLTAIFDFQQPAWWIKFLSKNIKTSSNAKQ